MKIAVLTEIINRKSGSRAPLEIAKALAELGHEITIFGYKKSFEIETEIELKKLKIKIKLIDSSRFFAIFEIYKELERGKFDVISFHGTLPFFLGALVSGIPIVRTYYGTQLDALSDKSFPKKPNFLLKLLNNCLNQLIKLQEKFIIKNSEKIIAISQYTQSELKEMYSKDAEFVYLGAPNNKSLPSNKVTNNQVTILSVSRIVPYKGFHILIKIFNKLNKKYQNLRLIVVGSSPNKKYLNYLRNIANKNVTFLINASDFELQTSYQNADIYVSCDRFMFFGMPPLEAASFGIPSVVLDYAAASEVVQQGKTGFVAKDEKEFEKYLKTLIDSRSLRVKMGNEAQKWAKKFSWEKTANVYLRVFKKLLQKSY